MPHLFVLNELSLAWFLSCLLLRRPVWVIAAAPLLPPLKPLFDRLADWSIKAGLARHAVDLTPDLYPYWRYDRRFFFQEIFKKYEPWQDRVFGFDQADANGPAYGYGYKLIVCNYLFPQVIQAYLLDGAYRALSGRVRCHGITPNLLAFTRELLGPDAIPTIRVRPWIWTVINTPVALVMMGVGILAVLRRTRLNPPVEPVFFAADYLADPRDLNIYEEVSEGGKVLLVARNPSFFQNLSAKAQAYQRATWADGRMGPRDALRTIALVVVDGWQLWRRHHMRQEPALFFRVIAMPFRRAIIRALLCRYRPAYFWGRDDYNVEHVLRTHEMRLMGGRSLGVTHAMLTVFCSLMPQWRYIHFDTYFVDALPLCEPYFQTWAKDMKLVSTGYFGWSRHALKETWPKGEDILVALRVGWFEPIAAETVQALARAFPHRRILLQLKRGYLSEAEMDALVNKLSGNLPNVFHVTDSIYALLEQARYLVSDVSTILAEAIEVGVYTFFLDVIDMEYSGFRLLPDLCCRTAAETIGKIQSIEDNNIQYDQKKLLKIMGLLNQPMFFDLVRSEVGLPILDPDFSYGRFSKPEIKSEDPTR